MPELIIDLHIHSKYSRACSKDLELPKIAKACEEKGIDIVVTGDFTHPAWFSDIEKLLEEEGGSGLFKIKDGSSKTRFMLGTEVSCIYKHKEKVRRLHLLIYAPNLNAARRLNEKLTNLGLNLKSDGRPILGMSAKEILRICQEIDQKMIVVPAHAWTPWFAVFGSKSGYDSLEDCFEELTSKVFAIETGLSSDPFMNRQLSALDKITLISNSDAHSLQKLGREANVISIKNGEKLTYDEIWEIIRLRDKDKFLYTIEFYPEEGMYHFDGHKSCSVSLTPSETKKEKYECPKCKKKVTVGVLHRVEELADRSENQIPVGFVPHKYIIPLKEIIADAFDVGVGSKKVANEYASMISGIGTEFEILLRTPFEVIKKNVSDVRIAEGIRNMRHGEVKIVPGYDGVYGKIDLFAETKTRSTQTQLI